MLFYTYSIVLIRVMLEGLTCGHYMFYKDDFHTLAVACQIHKQINKTHNTDYDCVLRIDFLLIFITVVNGIEFFISITVVKLNRKVCMGQKLADKNNVGFCRTHPLKTIYKTVMVILYHLVS